MVAGRVQGVVVQMRNESLSFGVLGKIPAGNSLAAKATVTAKDS